MAYSEVTQIFFVETSCYSLLVGEGNYLQKTILIFFLSIFGDSLNRIFPDNPKNHETLVVGGYSGTPIIMPQSMVPSNGIVFEGYCNDTIGDTSMFH